MKLYSEGKNYKLYNGNMLDLLQVVEPCSIDSIVTDPPYELNFMNKGWDNSGIAFQKETWEKCYEALKPGGYLLAFGGSRTFHRIACAIEDAGFEIRDTIMWLYGAGFPKSMNIGLAIDKRNGVESELEGKKWNGWGTALKPAFEPIIVARKPCEGSCVDNVLKYGVGGINIDECRIPFEDTPNPATNPLYRQQNGYKHDRTKSIAENSVVKFSASKNPTSPLGRFPANVILTYDETDEQEVCGGFPTRDNPNGSITKLNYHNSTGDSGIYGHYSENVRLFESYGDSGSAARYFYCAKASKKDRDDGLDAFQEHRKAGYWYDIGLGCAGEGMFKERNTQKRNTHPTVKPTELMQYLVRLVTPNGGTVLDPFNGSGSTGKAVMYENRERNKNYNYIGIELTEEYLPISLARIEFACTGEIADVPDNSPVIKEKKNVPKKEVLW